MNTRSFSRKMKTFAVTVTTLMLAACGALNLTKDDEDKSESRPENALGLLETDAWKITAGAANSTPATIETIGRNIWKIEPGPIAHIGGRSAVIDTTWTEGDCDNLRNPEGATKIKEDIYTRNSRTEAGIYHSIMITVVESKGTCGALTYSTSRLEAFLDPDSEPWRFFLGMTRGMSSRK